MLEQPPLDEQALKSFAPQAIVVLGGGAWRYTPEYGGITVPSPASLTRLAYASYLVRRTGLPVLVSSGYGARPEESEAAAMRWSLEAAGIATRWVEDKSTNTRENATLSAAILKPDGVTKVLLVTSATHARRATRAFEKAGLQVLSAPTGYSELGPREQGLLAVVPTSARFQDSSDALRALLGEVWYRLLGS